MDKKQKRKEEIKTGLGEDEEGEDEKAKLPVGQSMS